MKKKLCIIASVPGGIVGFHKTNIEELSKTFDIYVIANFTDKSEFSELNIVDAFPVNIERRPTIWSNLKALRCMYKIFRREKFDGFLSMTINASLLAAIAGKLAGISVRVRIFTGQLWAHMTGFKRMFFKTLDKITVALDTSLLVDGKPQREYLIQQGILKQEQAGVLANGSICGVDIERFKPNPEIRKEERCRLNIADTDIAFAFMGRVNRDKGIFELLAATNELAIKYNNLKLVLIGDMEGLTEDVIKQYSNLKVGDNVLLYGYTRKPNEALLVADVFCLPSYREGFGMSAIEAACVGLPVICSDAYGLGDSYVDGITGLKCKVKDVKSLAEAMENLYKNAEMRQSMASEGRKRVVNKFNKALVADAWHEYFKQKLS